MKMRKITTSAFKDQLNQIKHSQAQLSLERTCNNSKMHSILKKKSYESRN